MEHHTCKGEQKPRGKSCNMTACLSEEWGNHTGPQGTYQHLWPATNSFTALSRMPTTEGEVLWEWPVNQTHHHIQSVALLIQSTAHSVLLGDSHQGTAEKPKQTNGSLIHWKQFWGWLPFPIKVWNSACEGHKKRSVLLLWNLVFVRWNAEGTGSLPIPITSHFLRQAQCSHETLNNPSHLSLIQR